LSGNEPLTNEYIIQHKLKQARDFESQGKYLHSIQIYHSLINEFPDYTEAYLHLAALYENNNNINSAEEMYKQLLSLAPEDDFRIGYAQLLIRKMDWLNALNILVEVNREKYPIVSFLAGFCYMFIKEYELAKINFLNFIAADEQPALIYETYFFLSKIDLNLKFYEDALKNVRRAETIFDDYWELYLLYARLYFEQDMFTHSLEYLQKTIKANSKNVIVNYWAGKMYLKMNENKKAQFHMNYYLDLIDTTTVEDCSNKTKKYLKAGKYKEALISFEMADHYIEKKNFTENQNENKNNSSQKLDGTDD
jgi:tetratricopeptide (TPR) repeat protein